MKWKAAEASVGGDEKRTVPKALKAIMDHKGTTQPNGGESESADELHKGFERLIQRCGDFRVQEAKAV